MQINDEIEILLDKQASFGFKVTKLPNKDYLAKILY